jgi:hypothetical protein
VLDGLIARRSELARHGFRGDVGTAQPRQDSSTDSLLRLANVYHGAREAFEMKTYFHMAGQVYPMALAHRIAGKYVPGSTRHAREVRVYWGRPDPRIDSKTYAAHMRQSAFWKRSGPVVVRTRALRYPPRWPDLPAQEKGVDVQLAIDYVMGIMRRTSMWA